MSPGEVGYSGRRRVVVVGHDVLAATRRVQWHAARLPPHERVPQPRVCGFPCRFARHAHDTLRVCQQEPKSAPGSGSEKCTNRGASEWRGGEAVGRAGAALGRRAPAGRGGRGLVLARPLSPKACAELAGVSYHTILRAIRSGHPRAFHPPGTTIYRVAPEDFHDWLYGAPVASRPSSRPQRARTLRTGTPMRVASRPHGHRERGGSERERGYPAAGRQASSALARRHRAMVSALAYGGLRPEEMLALIWADVRPEALIVERALARGELRGDDLRKRHNRVVRLLARLAKDLAEWRLACGRPARPRSCSRARTAARGATTTGATGAGASTSPLLGRAGSRRRGHTICAARSCRCSSRRTAPWSTSRRRPGTQRRRACARTRGCSATRRPSRCPQRSRSARRARRSAGPGLMPLREVPAQDRKPSVGLEPTTPSLPWWSGRWRRYGPEANAPAHNCNSHPAGADSAEQGSARSVTRWVPGGASPRTVHRGRLAAAGVPERRRRVRVSPGNRRRSPTRCRSPAS
jgi:hypothetical protein